MLIVFDPHRVITTGWMKGKWATQEEILINVIVPEALNSDVAGCVWGLSLIK